MWISVHQFYQYHYSTLTKTIQCFSTEDQKELYKIVGDVCEIGGFAVKDVGIRKYQLFQGDTTSTFHSYSNCLENRGYVYNAMEQISFQKKIKIGYRYSYINISGRENLTSAHWSMPCSIERVKTTQSSEAVLLEQLTSIFSRGFFSQTKLNVLVLDSGYGTPKYLGNLSGLKQEIQDDLVNIVALRRGRKVWESYKGEYSGNGSPQIYGTKYYLNDETVGEKIGLGATQAVQTIYQDYTNSKDKTYKVELSLWKSMKLRTSDGVNMKEVEFSVVRVRQIAPQTGEIKGKPLWLSVHGKRKEEIDLWDIFQLYKCRFDIEHYFRFGKQKLLLNDYQTPEEEHYNNWHQIVAIAYWFLFAASQDILDVRMPWEIYEKKTDNQTDTGQRKSPAQTKKGMEQFISTFENLVTVPKSRNKGKGRQNGTVMTKRECHKVVRKGKKNTVKSKVNSE